MICGDVWYVMILMMMCVIARLPSCGHTNAFIFFPGRDFLCHPSALLGARTMTSISFDPRPLWSAWRFNIVFEASRPNIQWIKIGISSLGWSIFLSNQSPGNEQVLTDDGGGVKCYTALFIPYITLRPVWDPECGTECYLLSSDMSQVEYYTIKASKNSIVCFRVITPMWSIPEKNPLLSQLYFLKCILRLLKRPHQR